MREIRQSGSEGGVADNGHPYPYSGKGVQASCLLGKKMAGERQRHSGKGVQASCQLTHSPRVLEVSSTEILIHLFPGGSYSSEFKRRVSQTLETINQRPLAHPKPPGRRLRFRLAHRSELDLKVQIET